MFIGEFAVTNKAADCFIYAYRISGVYRNDHWATLKKAHTQSFQNGVSMNRCKPVFPLIKCIFI